jgi:predicted transcriptional regulator
MLTKDKGPDLEDALQQLGAKRIEATLVASLALEGALGTREIVERTGLRQPEVSVGMQVLRSRHGVEAEAVPRQGKGRPMHRYRLVAQPADMLAYYESEGRRTIDRFNSAMTTVRRYFQSTPSGPRGNPATAAAASA